MSFIKPRKAMKTMKIDQDSDDRNEENEVILLQRLRHHHVIRYFEHFDEAFLGSDYFCVVYELCEVIYFTSFILSYRYNHLNESLNKRMET